MSHMILAINPGSTSTKWAVYQGTEVMFKETIYHDDEAIMKYRSIQSQMPFRLKMLLDAFHEKDFDLAQLNAIVGRGGLLKPLTSGTYHICEKVVKDAMTGRYGDHASNLGPILAYELATMYEIPSYIVDPVGVDELIPEARVSGLKDIERKSHAHALNIKAVSRKVATQIGRPLEELNFVVAHLGGGISVVAQQNGQMIDVNNADNEGPFSPERCGGLPAKQLIQLCFSGKYSEKEMLHKLTKSGGIYSYLGTKNLKEVEERALSLDREAALLLKAMVHQIAKEIGAMAAVLEGRIDGIILTGGISHSSYLVGQIRKKIGFLGEIFVVPGEEELGALAEGAFRVLNGQELARKYEKG
jgi:butyrate kinase